MYRALVIGLLVAVGTAASDLLGPTHDRVLLTVFTAIAALTAGLVASLEAIKKNYRGPAVVKGI